MTAQTLHPSRPGASVAASPAASPAASVAAPLAVVLAACIAGAATTTLARADEVAIKSFSSAAPGEPPAAWKFATLPNKVATRFSIVDLAGSRVL